MSAIVFLLFLFSIVGVVVISIGVGIGYLLTQIIPGVEIGLGVVAGAIFSLGILSFCGKIFSITKEEEYSNYVDDEDIEIESNEIIITRKPWKSSKLLKKQRRKGR